MVVEAVAIALLGVLVAGLLRSHAEILRALHGLGVRMDPDADASPTIRPQPGVAAPRVSDTPASDISGTTPDGDAVAVGVVGTRQPTLLAFLSSGCMTCAGFWDAFADVERLSVPGDARLVVVTKGPGQESESRVAELAPPDVVVVMSDEAWEAYKVPVAPYFIYVDGDAGRIVGEGAAGTWEHVADLTRQALADAGLAQRRTRGRRRQVASVDTGSRVDNDLLSAGIHPGHSSLYRSPMAPEVPEEGG